MKRNHDERPDTQANAIEGLIVAHILRALDAIEAGHTPSNRPSGECDGADNGNKAAESLADRWNYRLVRMDESSLGEPWYEIHEVHYAGDGKPALWAEGASKAAGESPQEVMNALLLMAIDANRRPVLRESEMPKTPKQRSNNRKDGI